MDQSMQQLRAKFGLAGFVSGALSLILVHVHFSDLLALVDKSSGAVIGETAAEIKQSAIRALAGKPAPAPLPQGPDFVKAIALAALCISGGAIMLGGIGLFRQEPQSLSYLAVGFGVFAIVMHHLMWVALLIAGVVLLTCIIQNLDSITS
jgi:hypothetical protein